MSCDAEVSEQYASIVRQYDICWLHIPVHDTRLMRCLQGIKHGKPDHDCLFWRNGPPSLQYGGEGGSFNVLHYHPWRVVMLNDVVGGDNIGMVAKPCSMLRFSPRTSQNSASRIVAYAVNEVDLLECCVGVEHFIPSMPDTAHAAMAK
ncbi:hypothetical protein GCM10009839_13920 [Catenulispora yoronensis]|uniref:Uncharacterized protein n=1 Tax=Catenulispora yoronensis TaxID=450799 RepID=A0ABN2TRV5_9ACTN